MTRSTLLSGGLMNNSRRHINDNPSRCLDQKSAEIRQAWIRPTLSQGLKFEVIFDSTHPEAHIGIEREVNVGLVGEAGISHQRDIGQ